MSKRLHRVAIAAGGMLATFVLVVFALGEIENQATGRQPAFGIFGIGQQRAKDIVYWDRLGLSDLGWISARAINRGIGKYSGQGNNWATGWVLVAGCGSTVIAAGAFGYCLTLLVGAPISKKLQNKPWEIDA